MITHTPSSLASRRGKASSLAKGWSHCRSLEGYECPLVAATVETLKVRHPSIIKYAISLDDDQ